MPSRWLQNAGQERGQRALARPVRAGDGEKVPSFDAQRYVAQRVGRRPGAAIAIVQVPCLQHRLPDRSLGIERGVAGVRADRVGAWAAKAWATGGDSHRARARRARQVRRAGYRGAQALDQPGSRAKGGDRVGDAERTSRHVPAHLAQSRHQLHRLRTPHSGGGKHRAVLVEGRLGSSLVEKTALGAEHQHLVHPSDQLVQLVLDDDDGVTPILSQAPQQREQLGRRARVEIRGRLVQHQYAGPHGKHRGQSHALLLTPRESVQTALPVVRQPHRGEGAVYRALDLLRGTAEVLQAEGDLVLDRQSAELSVGILKDQSDLLGEQVHRTIAHHQPGHGHPARVVALDQMRDQPVQAERERALARSAGAQHQQGLARLHGERQVDQRRLDPGGVGERQPFGGYRRRSEGSAQILCTFPLEMASPESTPVLARASPRSCDRPPPRITDPTTHKMAAMRMLLHE